MLAHDGVDAVAGDHRSLRVALSSPSATVDERGLHPTTGVGELSQMTSGVDTVGADLRAAAAACRIVCSLPRWMEICGQR